MPRLLLPIVLATACCVATSGAMSAAPEPASTAYRLQMPGDFHRDEPVARDGQLWLALRVGADGRARLEQARLRVLAVEDLLGDVPGETSGRRVEADGAEALAFVRGPTLRSGPVEMANIEPLGLAGLPDARIVFAGHEYRLQTDCAASDAASDAGSDASSRPTLLPDCRVVLRRGTAETVLMEAPASRFVAADGTVYTSLGDDATPQLLFAGDLDRDGRLDLLFDVTDHYNVQRPTLFLSGPAWSGPVLSSPAASRPDVSSPVPPQNAPSGADTPAPAETGEALPLRAVAKYEAVGC